MNTVCLLGGGVASMSYNKLFLTGGSSVKAKAPQKLDAVFTKIGLTKSPFETM